MNMSNIQKLSADELMKSVIQKIATGPTQSKDISREEAKQCMSNILDNKIDEVRTSIFLIALQMKRETDDENLGIHDAIIETTKTENISINNLVNIADPYDGFTRHIPSSAFIPPVLAELELPTISHGLETVGPKYGCTHHMTYKELGLNPNLTHDQNIERLLDPKIGWGYIDQSQFNNKLFNLMPLRKKIIKRPAITTVEVLVKPISAKKNHFVTGYVHKAYPPVYLKLARNAGFDSSIVLRGTEGGIIPSLSQTSKAFYYKNTNEDDQIEQYNPKKDCGIDQSIRAVEIPKNASTTSAVDKIESKIEPLDIAKESVKQGMDALKGKDGPMKDCIIFGASIILSKITGHDINHSKNEIKKVLDSGSAVERMKI